MRRDGSTGSANRGPAVTSVGPPNCRVSCEEEVTDDLYGPAGIVGGGPITFSFDGRYLRVQQDMAPYACTDPPGTAARYLVDLRVWAARAHPEFESFWEWGSPRDSAIAIPCTPYPFTTVEGAASIAAVVPEFLEQSLEWPVKP